MLITEYLDVTHAGNQFPTAADCPAGFDLVDQNEWQFFYNSVADCGLKLKCIPTEQRFEFWKKAGQQIAHPEKPIYLKEFPNETAYIASQWLGRAGECLILLEKHH
ncbi:MAG TPA: hypothetical protein VJN89_18315 [Candidatus Acidoferrum sp.]|nr:hypothetical protein [Candidatus Acidoferrum sp.]